MDFEDFKPQIHDVNFDFHHVNFNDFKQYSRCYQYLEEKHCSLAQQGCLTEERPGFGLCLGQSICYFHYQIQKRKRLHARPATMALKQFMLIDPNGIDSYFKF